MEIFTDELIQDYSSKLSLGNYVLMNHRQFYQWWTSDVPVVPKLTRSVSYDIILKTCSGITETYSKRALDAIKSDPNMDLIIAINTSLPSTTDDEKIKTISGFLASKYEECRQVTGVYSAHLICKKQGQIDGKILMGAYLYCIKNGSAVQKGILEIAGGYTNISAFFSYTKMGFNKDLDLYGMNCFADASVLPMSVNVDELSNDNIIGYVSGTNKRKASDDTGLFLTGVPKDERQHDLQIQLAEIAQDYYVLQLVQKYQEETLLMFEDTIHKYGGTIEKAISACKKMMDKLNQQYHCTRGCWLFSRRGGKRKRKRTRKRII